MYIQSFFDNISKPTKDEIITIYCNLANNYCLRPWEIVGSTQLFEKYNIKEDDFIKILPSNPYDAKILGIENWKPKLELSDKELKKEQYKIIVWKSIKNISNNIINKKIIALIEKDYFKNWEHLYKTIKKYI